MRERARRILAAVACLLIVGATTDAKAAALSTRDTIEQALPRVVKIFGAGGLAGLEAYGTGILVSPEGHVATVWSHLLDREMVTVVLNDGRRFAARVLGAEPHLDLAVLKLDAEDLDLPYFDVERSADAPPGTRVLAFSNMFKVATGDEPVSVVHGVIAARTELIARRGTFEAPYSGPAYIVDAVTNNSGAGGGVLLTRDGRLLGMIGKELRNARSNTWINYAVPISELRTAISQIITGRYEPQQQSDEERDRPNRYAPVDFGLIMIPDVLHRTPAYVDVVLPGSAAHEAGFQRGDLILFVNDEIVQSQRVLAGELGLLEAGDQVRLIVRRGAKLLTFELPVERKDDNAQ